MAKPKLATKVAKIADDDVAHLLAQLDGPVAELVPAIPEHSDVELLTPIIEPPVIDVPKHVKNFEIISGEILGSWRADREEAQSAANLLRDLIEDSVQKGMPPNGTWLEAYVGAIKAKSDANATATKLLDATLKLIQMNKPTVNVKNTTNNTLHYNDLNAILADPVRDDDV